MTDRGKQSDSVRGSGFALHCRGDVRLYCGDTDCTPKSKKGRALLAILAAEQRPLTRVKIIDLLWSDRQEEQARASLRTLLADLKEQFDSRFDDLLIVDRERVALGSSVRTDLTDPTLAKPAGELFEGLDHIDPELDEWLRIEREKWAKAIEIVSAPGGASTEPLRRTAVPQWALALVLVAAIVVGALLYFRPWAMAEQPVVAVLKFKDVTGRNAPLADGLAEQLRVELAQYPDLGVIGEGSIEAEPVQGKSLPKIAKLLDATHVLEGAVVPHDGQLQLSLRLYSSSSNRPIWSAHLPATGPAILSGESAVAPAIAELVGDVAQRRADDAGMQADEKAYSDLFRARSLAAIDDPEKIEEARKLLFEIVSRYPNLAPALVSLARVTMNASSRPLQGLGTMPVGEARREAERYARRAIAAAPGYGPAYNALGRALDGTDGALAPYCRAAELSPGSGPLQTNCGFALVQKGDISKGLRYERAGAQLDPLNLAVQWAYAQALLFSGQREQSRAVIDDYLSRGIADLTRHQMRAVAELTLFGDWSNCYIAAMQALRLSPDDPTGKIHAMWASLLLYGPKAALPYARPDSLTQLILRDDVDAVSKRVRELDDEFWSLEYETPATLHYLLSKNRSVDVVAAFDRAVQRGMSLDVLNSEHIVSALRMVGRNKQANELIADSAKKIANWKGSDFSMGAYKMAMEAALARRPDDAIKLLRIAHRTHWWISSEPLDHPYNNFAYKTLRTDSRFRAIVNDYDRWVEQQRRKTASEARKFGLPPPPTSPPPPAMTS